LELDLEDGSGGAIRFAFRKSVLYVYEPVGSGTTESPQRVQSLLAADTTFRLSVVVDTLSNTASVYVDGILRRANVATPINGVTSLAMINMGAATEDVRYKLDEVRIVTGDIFAQILVADVAILSLVTNSDSATATETTAANTVPARTAEPSARRALIGRAIVSALLDSQLPSVADSDSGQGESPANESDFETLADEVITSVFGD
jgi:hypothetical protein